MAFSRFRPFLILFAPAVAFAQTQTTEVADVNYWASRQTFDNAPGRINETAFSKQPDFAKLYSLNASGQNLNGFTANYGFKWGVLDVYPEGSTDNTEVFQSGFTTMLEYWDAEQIVEHAASLVGTPYEGLTCSALVDAGYSDQCQFPPLIPGEDPPGACYYFPLNGSPTTDYESTLQDCLDHVNTTANAEFASLGVPGPGRVWRTTCSGGQLYFDYLYNGSDEQYMGLFAFDDSICRIPLLNDPAPNQPEHDVVTEPTPDTEVTDAQIAGILQAGGAITENFLIGPDGNITYFSSTGRTAEQTSRNMFESVYMPNTGYTTVVPADVVEGPLLSYSWAGFSFGGESPTPTPAPSATPNPSPTPGEGEGDCLLYPESLGCMNQDAFFDEFFDGLMEFQAEYFDALVPGDWVEDGAFTVPTQEAEGSAVVVELAEANSCPEPRTIAVWGNVYSLDEDQLLCTALEEASIIVRLCCSVFAAFIIVGARFGGDA